MVEERALALMERMKRLPLALQPQNVVTIVEATPGSEAYDYMAGFYDRSSQATDAAIEWMKQHGAVGFYEPSRSHGTEPRPATVYAFEKKPEEKGWVKAGRGYVPSKGNTPYAISSKSGKALLAELDDLPGFPAYHEVSVKLGSIDTLRYGELGSPEGGGFMSVGHDYRTHKLYFTVPLRAFDRYFIRFPNHNFTIWQQCESAIEHPDHDSHFEFADDPVSWRPPEGWTLMSEPEFNLVIAEARVRQLREKEAA